MAQRTASNTSSSARPPRDSPDAPDQADRYTISFDLPSDHVSSFSDYSSGPSPPHSYTRLFKPCNFKVQREPVSHDRASLTSFVTQSSAATAPSAPAAQPELRHLIITFAAFALPLPKSVPSVRLTAVASFNDGRGPLEIGRTESMLIASKNSAIPRAQWTQTIPVSLQRGDREMVSVQVTATPAAARDATSSSRARQRRQLVLGEAQVEIGGRSVQNVSLFSRNSPLKVGSLTVFVEDHDVKGERGCVEFTFRSQEIKPRQSNRGHLADQYFEVQKIAGGTKKDYWVPVYRSELMRKRDSSGFVHFDPLVISCQRLNAGLVDSVIRIVAFRANAATGSSEVMGIAKISQQEVQDAISERTPLHWPLISDNPTNRIELHLSRSSRLLTNLGHARFDFEVRHSASLTTRPKGNLVRTYSFAQFPLSSLKRSNTTRDEVPFIPEPNVPGPEYRKPDGVTPIGYGR